jgi:hypothetical protein
MLPDMPKPIAAYFAADAKDPLAVANCFVEDGVVVDERETHQGRTAISRWKASAAAKFAYTSEPFALSRKGDRVQVKSRVTGNFPGSPVDLRYAFVLAGDLIARLEIVP